MELTLLHFFPDRLNLYGDRGNILVLKKRCEWRNIKLNIKKITGVDGIQSHLNGADILFIGGGSDREQSIVTLQLHKIKKEFQAMVEDGVAALTICGGYQFLGSYYELSNGLKLKGLEVLDFYTLSKPTRLIGNLLMETKDMGTIVGFENHVGRTYHEYESFGTVISGFGNNGEDAKEGLRYKNLIGTYLHGPLLPKNPTVADWLLEVALKRKYGSIALEPLNDNLENLAKQFIWEHRQRN
ncbi:type 1 glutamine amidotransferase [Bacillus sp. Marseille-P3661]|uniref:type 1 glutamine amidotransferase n=1 Tax=Bacillus sp. Marseille-P3661 TaxID=1936234 RepID=UPI000C8513EF|nr:glutamine amidotransferase [Bacillus sp. Marseille-P3661]